MLDFHKYECYNLPRSPLPRIPRLMQQKLTKHDRPVAYRDFSGQACNDEMMTSSVSKFSSILIFDKTSNF